MGRVRCYDCGKLYNYQEDAFCPHCGAFNQLPRASRIGADGSVVRVDGLNEAGHQGSFTHREFHEEERERRRTGLDRSVQRIRRSVKPLMSSAMQSERPGPRKEADQDGKGLLKVIGWIAAGVIALNVLSRVVYFFV